MKEPDLPPGIWVSSSSNAHKDYLVGKIYRVISQSVDVEQSSAYCLAIVIGARHTCKIKYMDRLIPRIPTRSARISAEIKPKRQLFGIVVCSGMVQ